MSKGDYYRTLLSVYLKKEPKAKVKKVKKTENGKVDEYADSEESNSNIEDDDDSVDNDLEDVSLDSCPPNVNQSLFELILNLR